MEEKISQNNIPQSTESDRVEITFYTDPLCCWSWGLLPGIRKLKTEYPHLIDLTYCMGGLIKDWHEFSDPLNSLNKPSQMGPMWMDAARLTATQIDDSIWVRDPPTSSYPACIAVKTAELQSNETGEGFLALLMEAVMEKGKNISKPEIILEVAEEFAQTEPLLFNLETFINTYNNEESRTAFRNDLQKVKYNGIGRFPTVTFSRYNLPGIVFTGFRPYEALLDAFANIAPAIKIKSDNQIK